MRTDNAQAAPRKRNQSEANMKLPFVWELEYTGVVSHAAGTLHYAFPIYPRESFTPLVIDKSMTLTEIVFPSSTLAYSPFTQEKICEIIELLRKIPNRAPLTEQERTEITKLINHHQFIDVAIMQASREQETPVRELETDSEHDSPYLNQHSRTYSPEETFAMKFMYTGGHTNYFTDVVNEGRVLTRRNFTPLQWKNYCNRNKVMAERAVPYLREAPTLVAVGLGHYLGPGNILERWEKEGVKVRRIQ